MDGYAVQVDDDSEEFQILETIGAGDVPSATVSKGKCVKIMTGAMMPDGADKVIRVEFTERNGDTVKVHTEEKGVM